MEGSLWDSDKESCMSVSVTFLYEYIKLFSARVICLGLYPLLNNAEETISRASKACSFGVFSILLDSLDSCWDNCWILPPFAVDFPVMLLLSVISSTYLTMLDALDYGGVCWRFVGSLLDSKSYKFYIVLKVFLLQFQYFNYYPAARISPAALYIRYMPLGHSINITKLFLGKTQQ